MNKPSRRTLLVGMVAFVVFCLVRVPVSLVSLFLPANIQLQHVEGTLWQGKAAALGLNKQIISERLEWSFLPAALGKARLEWLVTARFAGKSGQMNVGVGFDGPALKNVDLFLPLEPLLAQHPQLKGLRLGGEAHVQAAQLKPGSKAEARVQIEGLFSALVPQQGVLGSYRIEADMQENGSGNWRLVSLAGILQAEGRGDFNINQGKIGGKVTLTPQAPIPGLSPALSALPASGQGYQLSF